MDVDKTTLPPGVTTWADDMPDDAYVSQLNEPEALLDDDALDARNTSLAHLASERRLAAARSGNVSIA